uniref:Uncharacterized protein n=1 Tax=Callorhinchus milii TaxID=7868 RepID=A0A4W3J421_CALMI
IIVILNLKTILSYGLRLDDLSNLSDQLIQTCEINEENEKEKKDPEPEYKKPRRKDTPVQHVPPLIPGIVEMLDFLEFKIREFAPRSLPLQHPPTPQPLPPTLQLLPILTCTLSYPFPHPLSPNSSYP